MTDKKPLSEQVKPTSILAPDRRKQPSVYVYHGDLNAEIRALETEKAESRDGKRSFMLLARDRWADLKAAEQRSRWWKERAEAAERDLTAVFRICGRVWKRGRSVQDAIDQIINWNQARLDAEAKVGNEAAKAHHFRSLMDRFKVDSAGGVYDAINALILPAKLADAKAEIERLKEVVEWLDSGTLPSWAPDIKPITLQELMSRPVAPPDTEEENE